jgi:hypothetical protein
MITSTQEAAVAAEQSHFQKQEKPMSKITMKTMSRRFFLARAATGTAVAALPAAGIAIVSKSALAATPPAEDPALLALGEQIDPLLKTYRAAVERKRAARALAEKLCPTVPDELVVQRHGMFSGCAERETDVEGKDVWPPPEADGHHHRPPRHIFQSALIEKSIANNNLYASPRSKFGKQIRKLIETAKKYEAERKTAIERSDIKAAKDGMYFAAADVEDLAYKVREIEPVTMIGIMIQARALVANSEAELDAHGFEGRSGMVLGHELATAVLRIGGMSPGA